MATVNIIARFDRTHFISSRYTTRLRILTRRTHQHDQKKHLSEGDFYFRIDFIHVTKCDLLFFLCGAQPVNIHNIIENMRILYILDIRLKRPLHRPQSLDRLTFG